MSSLNNQHGSGARRSARSASNGRYGPRPNTPSTRGREDPTGLFTNSRRRVLVEELRARDLQNMSNNGGVTPPLFTFGENGGQQQRVQEPTPMAQENTPNTEDTTGSFQEVPPGVPTFPTNFGGIQTGLGKGPTSPPIYREPSANVGGKGSPQNRQGQEELHQGKGVSQEDLNRFNNWWIEQQRMA